jgi:hypothetical protein
VNADVPVTPGSFMRLLMRKHEMADIPKSASSENLSRVDRSSHRQVDIPHDFIVRFVRPLQQCGKHAYLP